jgi:hypothetical protein
MVQQTEEAWQAQVVHTAARGVHVTVQEMSALTSRGWCGADDLQRMLDEQVQHAKECQGVLNQRKGSWHCLVGPAGSGKSCVRLVSEHILTTYTNFNTAQVGGKKWLRSQHRHCIHT